MSTRCCHMSRAAAALITWHLPKAVAAQRTFLWGQYQLWPGILGPPNLRPFCPANDSVSSPSRHGEPHARASPGKRGASGAGGQRGGRRPPRRHAAAAAQRQRLQALRAGAGEARWALRAGASGEGREVSPGVLVACPGPWLRNTFTSRISCTLQCKQVSLLAQALHGQAPSFF